MNYDQTLTELRVHSNRVTGSAHVLRAHSNRVTGSAHELRAHSNWITGSADEFRVRPDQCWGTSTSREVWHDLLRMRESVDEEVLLFPYMWSSSYMKTFKICGVNILGDRSIKGEWWRGWPNEGALRSSLQGFKRYCNTQYLWHINT